MNWKNPQSVETKIRRLTREIAKIDDVLYNINKTGDRVLYAGMLERKRDDMVRYNFSVQREIVKGRSDYRHLRRTARSA